MTIAPIQLLVSVNGGGYISGAQQAAFGDTVSQQAASTFGFSQVRYDIYDYPYAMTTPSGWSFDPVTGAYYYQPTNVTTAPPDVTLPSSGANNWGPLMLRLRGNANPLRLNPDGSPNASFNPAWTDETSMVWIPSPNAGMQGVGFGETIQRDSMRGYVGTVMQSLRAADANGGGGGGGGFPTFTAFKSADANLDLSTHLTENILATVTGQSATRTVTLPNSTGAGNAGQLVVVYSSGAHAITLDGGCNNIQQSGSSGEFMTVTAGNTVVLIWDFGSGGVNWWRVVAVYP